MTRHITPGDWYAVLGPRVSAAVPRAARELVQGLWEAVDGVGTADAVLDELLTRGVAGLPAFVIVEHGPTTRVVVRGPAEVVLRAEDEHTVVAPHGHVWTEAHVDGVTGGSVRLGDASGDAAALVAGIVPAGLVEFGEPAAPDADDGATDQVVDDLPEVAAEADGESSAAAAGVEGAAGEEPAVQESVAPEPVDLEPVVPVPVSEPESVPVPVPEPELSAPRGAGWGAPVGGPAFPAPVPPPVVPVPPAPPAAPTFGQTGPPPGFQFPAPDSEDTIIGIPTGPVVEDKPGEVPVPSVLARPVATLVFSTGDVVAVDRVILVGRAPEARRFASEDMPQLVSVTSPNQEISSTHLEIRPGTGVDHGMAVVTDLGSTNGTVLVQPGLPPEELQPGIAVALIPGAILDLGDGVTIQTTNP